MLTSPFQHYGLDWLAMLLTFIAIYSLGAEAELDATQGTLKFRGYI